MTNWTQKRGYNPAPNAAPSPVTTGGCLTASISAPNASEMRLEIAKIIDPRAFSGGREDSALYKPDRARALHLADTILVVIAQGVSA